MFVSNPPTPGPKGDTGTKGDKGDPGDLHPRSTSIASSATPTVNTDLYDAVDVTALAVNVTSMSSGLTGTPVNFQRLMYRIKDDGTARTIAWGASFEAMGFNLPTTTVAGKRMLVLLQWNAATSKWGCVSVQYEL